MEKEYLTRFAGTIMGSFRMILGAVILFVATSGFAQGVVGSKNALPFYELDSVVVTASRTPTEVANVPQAVDVVTSEEVEMIMASFGTDLLKSTSSVDVIQYPGGASGVSIRGFRPEYNNETNPRVLLLIDGRPVSMSLGSVPTNNIDRIEVLKGAASAVYGPSAMGGVINVITRRSTGGMQGSMFTGYGSFDHKEAGVAYGGSLNDQLDFDLSLDWLDRGDDYRFGSGDDYEVGRNGGDTYLNTTFSRLNGMLRLGYQLSEDWRIGFNYDVSDQSDTGVPGPLSEQKYEVMDLGIRDLKRQGGSVDILGNIERHALSAKVYFNDLDSFLLYSDDAYAESYRGRSNDKQIEELGFQAQDLWTLSESHEVIFGVDYLNQEESNLSKYSDGSILSYYLPDYERERVGTFVELFNHFRNDTIVLNLGGRIDRVKTTVEASTYEGTSYQYVGGSESFSHFNPRIGGVWKVNDQWRVHSSVGTAFIAPESREIAGYYESEYSSYWRINKGNADLDPESSVTWDLGLGYRTKTANWDFTVFRTNVEDRIISINTGETEAIGEDGKTRRIYSYVNADSQSMRGAELSGEYDLTSLFDDMLGSWIFSADITYIDSAEVKIDETTYEPVKNVADWKGNLSLRYGGAIFSTRFNARYNGSRMDKDYTYNDFYGGDWYEYPDYWVFDWSASCQLNESGKIILRVDNILDKYYYEKLDYPQEGRMVSARYVLNF